MQKTKQIIIELIISCLLIAGCATVPITGRKQLSLLPQSQMVAVSKANFETLLKQSKISVDPNKKNILKQVGTNIARAAEKFMQENGMSGDMKYYDWQFEMIEDDKTVNAFCMPGGKIAVYTGILPYMKDENGMAVVIGHEVAHAIANHGNERMSQLLLVQLGGLTLAKALEEKPEETKKYFLVAFGLGANLGFVLPYSRKHEYEADKIGLILMARAGYDPNGAVVFWERMKSLSGSRPPEFLSTHPAPDNRIQDIKKAIPEAMKYYNQ